AVGPYPCHLEVVEGLAGVAPDDDERGHAAVSLCLGVCYLFDPRLTRAVNSATRLPKVRASTSSLSSMPGESGPVVALAPNAPPPTTTIWFTSIAASMVSIVISFPLEIAPPVANAAPTLLRILRSRQRSNFSNQLSKNVFTSPDMFPKYTGDPTMIASQATRS